MSVDLKRRVPWWVKIAVKIVLSRVPVPFSVWRRLSIFRHGAMNRPDYVLSVFERHLGGFMHTDGLRGRTILELGPGDGISTGLLAFVFGAERTILVDAGDFASRDLDEYRQMLVAWRKQGLKVDALLRCGSFSELCSVSNTIYLTDGINSLRQIDANSVDLQISNAVLEHVRRGEFAETLGELLKILKPGGFSSHEVDLKDHLGGALNNLRFSERIWESEFLAGSGFYTNRIRFSEMLAIFVAAGFESEVTKTWRWSSIPTTRSCLHESFRDIPDSDLLVSAFDIVARKSVSPST